MVVLVSGLVGVLAWGVYHYRILPLPSAPHSSLPEIAIVDGVTQVKMPNGNLLGDVGNYSDELTAYLRFEYLEGLPSLSGTQILMTSTEMQGKPVYRLYLVLPNNVFPAVHRLEQLRIDGFIEGFRLLSPPTVQLRDWEEQTRLFDSAYLRQVRKRLLQLPQSELTSAVAEFILFKVKTDPRVWKQIVPVKKVVSPEESEEFAADMIAVAKFYKI